MGKRKLSLVLIAGLMPACVTLPKPLPLAFEPTKLTIKHNPVKNYKPTCSSNPVITACPTGVFNTIAKEVNSLYAQAQSLEVHNNIMVLDSRSHDRADIKRHALVQDKLRTMQWKTAGWTAGGLLVGLVAGLLVAL